MQGLIPLNSDVKMQSADTTSITMFSVHKSLSGSSMTTRMCKGFVNFRLMTLGGGSGSFRLLPRLSFKLINRFYPAKNYLSQFKKDLCVNCSLCESEPETVMQLFSLLLHRHLLERS